MPEENTITNENLSSRIIQTEIHNIWESVLLTKNTCLSIKELSDPVIFFLIDGSAQLTVNETDIYTINLYEMFLLPNAYSCKIEALSQSSIMACSLSIEILLSESKFLEDLMFEYSDSRPTIRKMPISKTILQFLLLLRKCMEEGLASYYFFELKRNELNLLLFAYYDKDKLAQFLKNVLSKDIQFKRFVLDNYLIVKNVQELAALANYSTSGFIKKFQKIFDESPYKWMQKQRAAKILIEINRGVKPLQEIANEYKFSSYQHFSAFCKVTFGFSPIVIYGKT